MLITWGLFPSPLRKSIFYGQKKEVGSSYLLGAYYVFEHLPCITLHECHRACGKTVHSEMKGIQIQGFQDSEENEIFFYKAMLPYKFLVAHRKCCLGVTLTGIPRNYI